jgi:hypothetical protein
MKYFVLGKNNPTSDKGKCLNVGREDFQRGNTDEDSFQPNK